jgi:hypothetical protein
VQVSHDDLIVNTTAFKSLAEQPEMNVFPMAREKEVVLPSAGLNTNTTTGSDCAMSAAVIVTTD